MVTPAALVRMMQRSNLQVGSVLVWGQGYSLDLPSFTGEDDPASQPGHIMHYDLEVSAFAAAQVGHLNLLGLSEVEFSDRPYQTPGSGVPVVEWALEQGPRVLVGMNHGWGWPGRGFPSLGQGCCPPFELPVHVANGNLSFLEEEIPGPGLPISEGTMLLWRVVQNSGFRVALTGASDYLCIIRNNLGSPDAMRTYVLIEGELSYEAFLDGIRAGRTVIAVGASDWMDLTVEGVRVGGEIETSAGAPLQVTIESDLNRRERVSVLVNGEPVQTLVADAGPQTHTLTLTLEKSSWITARTSRVQTSAIYALVDGQPIRASADDACYLVRYMDYLSNLVFTGAFTYDATEALPAYQRARDLFEQRFFEAGGTTCGNFPVARFTGSPQMGEAPLRVCVDAAASTTPEGTQIVSYEWDFGDGTTEMGVNACHTYTVAGRYDITLTVRNDARRSGGMIKRVFVSCPSEDVTPWTSVDIGEPAMPGGARLEAEALEICAGGLTISGRNDECFFLYQEVVGDAELLVNVSELRSGLRGAAIGLMFRAGLEDNAPYAAMLLTVGAPPDQTGRFRFRARTASGDPGRSRGSERVDTPAGWLRIQRHGDLFRGWGSVDGSKPTLVVQQEIIGLPQTMLVGVVAMGRDFDPSKPFEALQARLSNLEVIRSPEFLRGDCNDDGTVDISDAVSTLGSLFLDDGDPGCDDACDSNDDDSVDISDAINTLGVLFLGNGVIPLPGMTECGIDPTADDLGCDDFARCP